MTSTADTPTTRPSAAVDLPAPLPQQRRDSLEKQLQTRPDEQDLKHRHILLDTTAAPALQARAAELERQRVTDHLRQGLARRPEKEELVGRNILPEGHGDRVAPALAQRRRELERNMRMDELDKKIQSRPDKEELVREGILKEGEEEEGKW